MPADPRAPALHGGADDDRGPARTPIIIDAARMLNEDGSFTEGSVTIDGGRITAVCRQRSFHPDAIDLCDGILAPGFIDLQFNGARGVDLAHADAAQWSATLAYLPTTGVTSVVATFVSDPLEGLLSSIQTAEQVRRDRCAGNSGGAQLAGVHLEGPFLSPQWRGAHNVSYLRQPDQHVVQRLLDEAGSLLSIVTLAPELPGASRRIQQLVRAGVVVSVGHSGATAAQVAHAADLGASMVTHLFNAQTGLHHRRPGVVGQALSDARLTATLIADLAHVAPQVCRIAFAAKPNAIALITDSVAAAGLEPGLYKMADGEVIVSADGPPRRPGGPLAGSALCMDQAVRNIVALGTPIGVALQAASRVPAEQLRRADLGRIATGANADLVWLSDELQPQATWVGGQLVHAQAHADA